MVSGPTLLGSVVVLRSVAPLDRFIHPSVYFLDNRYMFVIRTLNTQTAARQIRKDIAFFSQDTREYLELGGHLQQNREAEYPRILLCGPSTIGKSTLINLILGTQVVGLPAST